MQLDPPRPSGLHRVLACPGARRAEAEFPDQGGGSAAWRGTALHDVAARCLQHGFDAGRYAGETFTDEDQGHAYSVEPADAEDVQVYLDVVRTRATAAKGSTLLIEHAVDMGSIYPGLKGTFDAAVIDFKAKRVDLYDYKSGYVKVEADDNDQLRPYAYGVITGPEVRKGRKLGITTVAVHIVQGGEVRSSADMSALEILEYGNALEEALPATEAADAPRTPGVHCKYCKAAPLCPELRASSAALARTQFGGNAYIEPPVEPSTLPPEELGTILAGAHLLELWIKAVKTHAHAEAERGLEIPGWKLVASRATRKWSSPEAEIVALGLDLGFDEEKLFKTELRSPAQMEKTLGKATFGAFGSMISKISTTTTLAPTTDTREALEAANDRARRAFEYHSGSNSPFLT